MGKAILFLTLPGGRQRVQDRLGRAQKATHVFSSVGAGLSNRRYRRGKGYNLPLPEKVNDHDGQKRRDIINEAGANQNLNPNDMASMRIL